MVSSSERHVVLCNESGKNLFCLGDFVGCGCLEQSSSLRHYLTAACIAMCVDPLFCMVMSFLLPAVTPKVELQNVQNANPSLLSLCLMFGNSVNHSV